MAYSKLETGDVDVLFLDQEGDDPFTRNAARDAQILWVARAIASFIGEARSTLDIAIYDMRLDGDALTTVKQALADARARGVQLRLVYDQQLPHPEQAEFQATFDYQTAADKKARGTAAFVETELTPYLEAAAIPEAGRHLMHHKYLVRDAASPDAAVWTGSSNFTNDSWGMQENNYLVLRSQALALYYARDFEGLWAQRRIHSTTVQDHGVVEGSRGVEIMFSPDVANVIEDRFVALLNQAERRVVASTLLVGSKHIMAAFWGAIQRGVPVKGICDGPQMEGVLELMRSNTPPNPAAAIWDRMRDHWVMKPSQPWDPKLPHNFMHNKILVVDDVLLTGSFNFSRNALKNAENLLVIPDADLAQAYVDYIERLLARYGSNG